MPYIKEEQRQKYNQVFWKLRDAGAIKDPGELNYLFSIIINHYLVAHGTRYQAINDIVGALEGAKLEAYRKIAAPYEDQKIEENGDIGDGTDETA